MKMTRSTYWLAIVLIIFAATALIQYWPTFKSSNFEDQLAIIKKVEEVADVAQRCKEYPDPPWLRWKPEVVAAFCESIPVTPTPLVTIKSEMDEGRVEIVDRIFLEYQQENFKGSSKHLLERMFSPFASDSPEIGDLAEKWVRLSPKSPFALVARGMHYQLLAFSSRGGSYSVDTPENNFSRMRDYASKARIDFESAIEMNPNVVRAYAGLIGLEQALGEHGLIDEAARRGLAIDPTDERVYLEWMAASEPQWGGSINKMQEIAGLAEKYLDKNPRLLLVVEKPVAYSAKSIGFGNEQYAMSIFDRALAIAPSAADLALAGSAALRNRDPERAVWYFSEAWRFSADPLHLAKRAVALKQLNRLDWADQSLTSVANFSTRNQFELDELVTSFNQLGEREKSEQVEMLLLDRNPRNERALMGLANNYLHEPKRSEKALPIVQALTREYPRNAEGWYYDFMLKYQNVPERNESLKKFLALVDYNDPNEQERIKIARAWLADPAKMH